MKESKFTLGSAQNKNEGLKEQEVAPTSAAERKAGIVLPIATEDESRVFPESNEAEVKEFVDQAKAAHDQKEAVELSEGKEAKEFNPKEHVKMLRERVSQIAENQLGLLLGELHATDLPTFNKVFSRAAIDRPGLHRFAATFAAQQFKKIKKEHLRGGNPNTQAEIEAKWSSFIRNLDDALGKELPPELLFGIEGTKEELLSRKEQLYLANLQNRPDANILGHLFIRATTALKQTEMPEPKNRKEPEPQPAIEQPESWLDEDKEAAFAEFCNAFRKFETEAGSDAIRQWFIDLWNPTIEQRGGKPLQLEDVASLQFVVCTSDNVSAVAGKRIERPVLLFTDISQYQKFSAGIHGGKEMGVASRGMNIRSSGFTNILAKTGMLVATPNKAFIEHEMFHSVDGNIANRYGSHTILSEAFAYYQQEVANAKLDGYKHLKKPEDGPWNSFARSIGADLEFERHVKKDEGISKEDYAELGKSISSALRVFADRFGHIAAQRLIARTKTVEEFFQVVNQQMGERKTTGLAKP